MATTDLTLNLMDQLCPPHDFRAGWENNDHGAIYCRFCGDVRPLTPQSIGPVVLAPVQKPAKGESER